jgi:hypothetical protein
MNATHSLAAAQAAPDSLPRLLEALGRPAFPGELARFLRDETGAAAASIREIREDAGEDRVVAATSPDAVAPPTALPVPGLCGRGEAWVDDVPLPAAGDRAVMRSASALVERTGPRAIVATLMRATPSPRIACASCAGCRCCVRSGARTSAALASNASATRSSRRWASADTARCSSTGSAWRYRSTVARPS